MGANTREIKARLNSISNTKKMTKAMELVSAAKMRRAVEAALGSRLYAKFAREMAFRLANSGAVASSDYLAKFFKASDDPKKFTILVVTSNRGLAGAFNSGVVKQVVKFVNEKGAENVEVICLGKKAVPLLSVYGVNAAQVYDKDDAAKNSESIQTVAQYLYRQFKNGETDQVLMAFTEYESTLVQTPVIQSLFPFSEGKGISEEKIEEETPDQGKVTDYYYEPGRRTVVSYLVPRLGESRIYQALLESNASEHSARMVAMKSATDAASEMYEDVKLAFNRARQAAITQEVAEISAGTAAVS